MKRFVFYDIYKEARGKVDLRLAGMRLAMVEEKEAVARMRLVQEDPQLPYRNANVLEPSRYELRCLRLPDDPKARKWIKTIVRENLLSSWPLRATKKVYWVMAPFKDKPGIDYCAGTFARIDEAKKVMDPGDRLIFAYVKNWTFDPVFFLSEEPGDLAPDMWGIDDEED
jgi:hypothetical protein